jgi:two-component system, NtrC family, response regulator AtoC
MSTGKRKKPTGPEAVNLLPPEKVLFGRSEAMKEVRRRATKVAGTSVPVLLYGPKGSGKEVLARWIHSHSGVSNGQFVKVNCAAIPGTLLESELFGFEKGAFTGAHATKPGRVELAHNGTLFLDEISDLDFSFQSKLLHFLQDGSFYRIGGDKERTIDTRLICATSKNLEEVIDAGRFRADLYYRINVIRLQLPELCQRKEDIPQLAKYFLSIFQQKFAKEAEPLPKEIFQYLRRRNWSGNIRELENCMARCVILGYEQALEFFRQERNSQLAEGEEQPGRAPLKSITDKVRRELEREVILKTLVSHNWNRRKAAAAMKISYRTLLYKVREAGLLPKRSRS